MFEIQVKFGSLENQPILILERERELKNQKKGDESLMMWPMAALHVTICQSQHLLDSLTHEDKL